MDKLIIPFNGFTPNEADQGFVESVNWDSLLPTIEKFVKLRPYEKIAMLSVTDVEIRITIVQKPGRKSSKKAELLNDVEEPA